MKYKDYFTGKKIAVIGLGPHGEMIPDIKFLFKHKADLSIYDPRNERLVQQFFLDLADTALFRYTFGNVPKDELLQNDIIIIADDIPREAKFLKEAREKGITIEYPTTLFLKLCPPVTLVGISGPCGKSTIFDILKDILNVGFKGSDQGFVAIDPEQSNIISQLKKTRKDDVVVLRITDKILGEMHEMRMSPHVVLLTDEVSPRAPVDPLKIFDFQTYNAYIVTTDKVADSLREKTKIPPKAKILRVRNGTVPQTWTVSTRGKHDRLNYAFAVETARLFKINDEVIRSVVETYVPQKSRMEPLKKIGNFEWYNDSYSVSPLSTLSAIETIGIRGDGDRRIVLIMGGAYTGDDYGLLLKRLPDLVHTVVLLPGSGTLIVRPDLEAIEGIKVYQAKDLIDALLLAKENGRKGDSILFSPAFDASGIWKTRRERNEAFLATLKAL